MVVNRYGVQVGLELRGELVCGGIPVFWIACEGFDDDGLELIVDQWVDRGRSREIAVGDSIEDLVRIATREGQRGGGEMKEHDPQREHVDAMVHGPAADELGRHEGGAAQELPGHRELLLVHELCDAKVHEFQASIVPNHDVVGLDVAMNDVEGVGSLEGVGEGADN